MPLRLCRYGAGDKVEAWLNDLLCLNAAEHIPPPPPQLPHPSECELYFVERDTLFSYHKACSQIHLRLESYVIAAASES
jgi:N-acetyltransferase 10